MHTIGRLQAAGSPLWRSSPLASACAFHDARYRSSSYGSSMLAASQMGWVSHTTCTLSSWERYIRTLHAACYSLQGRFFYTVRYITQEKEASRERYAHVMPLLLPMTPSTEPDAHLSPPSWPGGTLPGWARGSRRRSFRPVHLASCSVPA